MLLALTAGYVTAFGLYRWRAHRAGPTLTVSDQHPIRELSRRVRIGTYNIAHGRGPHDDNHAGGDQAERDARLTDIAALLRDVDADIWVLNEVDFDSAWSYGIDQARVLADRAGYPYVATQTNLDVPGFVPTGPYRFGNAILSKVPLDDCAVIALPGLRGWETVVAGKKRGLVCRVGGHDGFDLYALHLSHRSERLRTDSMRFVLEHARGRGLEAVLAGDFNSAPSGVPGHDTDDKGRNAVDELVGSRGFVLSPHQGFETRAGLSFPSTAPDRAIDWVAAPKSWTRGPAQVVDSTLSDHRPVVAEWVRPAR